NPFTVLVARVEALAMLVDAGDMDSEEAFERLTAGAAHEGDDEHAHEGDHSFDQIVERLARENKAKERHSDTLPHKSMSVAALWDELNDPRRRPTPQVTIEAILCEVREGGFEALKKPANIERLSWCDEAAKAEIERRIAKLASEKEILNARG